MKETVQGSASRSHGVFKCALQSHDDLRSTALKNLTLKAAPDWVVNLILRIVMMMVMMLLLLMMMMMMTLFDDDDDDDEEEDDDDDDDDDSFCMNILGLDSTIPI